MKPRRWCQQGEKVLGLKKHDALLRMREPDQGRWHTAVFLLTPMRILKEQSWAVSHSDLHSH